jgi:creatinine amidohydrolase
LSHDAHSSGEGAQVADLTWDVVAKRLKGGAAALLPIGAGAKQHGLHMRMATDQVFAEYFAGVVAEKTNSLIWPTLTYGAYPAFVAYAGSASLSNATFQSAVKEIANALLGFGAQTNNKGSSGETLGDLAFCCGDGRLCR